MSSTTVGDSSRRNPEQMESSPPKIVTHQFSRYTLAEEEPQGPTRKTKKEKTQEQMLVKLRQRFDAGGKNNAKLQHKLRHSTVFDEGKRLAETIMWSKKRKVHADGIAVRTSVQMRDDLPKIRSGIRPPRVFDQMDTVIREKDASPRHHTNKETLKSSIVSGYQHPPTMLSVTKPVHIHTKERLKNSISKTRLRYTDEIKPIMDKYSEMTSNHLLSPKADGFQSQPYSRLDSNSSNIMIYATNAPQPSSNIPSQNRTGAVARSKDWSMGLKNYKNSTNRYSSLVNTGANVLDDSRQTNSNMGSSKMADISSVEQVKSRINWKHPEVRFKPDLMREQAVMKVQFAPISNSIDLSKRMNRKLKEEIKESADFVRNYLNRDNSSIDISQRVSKFNRSTSLSSMRSGLDREELIKHLERSASQISIASIASQNSSVGRSQFDGDSAFARGCTRDYNPKKLVFIDPEKPFNSGKKQLTRQSQETRAGHQIINHGHLSPLPKLTTSARKSNNSSLQEKPTMKYKREPLADVQAHEKNVFDAAEKRVHMHKVAQQTKQDLALKLTVNAIQTRGKDWGGYRWQKSN